jgi:hypothetical protein
MLSAGGRTVVLLAIVLAVWPVAARADGVTTANRAFTFTERASLSHGIAGDERFIFLTEPGIGPSVAGPRVVVLDRRTRRKVGVLPAPADGFKLPFTLRVPETGHLVVLDNAGFPPEGPPSVYDYRYRPDGHGGVRANITRSTSFKGLPLLFGEDIEVLPNGEYVVSESVIGGLWLIEPDGKIKPGLVPSGMTPLAKLGPCQFAPGTYHVGDLPFEPMGGFAPGAGSLATRGSDLYVSSTCAGGIMRVPLKVLRDTTRPAEQRVAEIKTVTPRQSALESLKGIQFDRWDPKDPWIYAGDPFHLRLIRVNSKTGARETLSTDARLFNFTVSTAFLPPAGEGLAAPLLTASDQEYRWTGLNTAIKTDAFKVPFVVAADRPPMP